MAVSAYLMIQTEMDKAAAVAEAIGEIAGVDSVDVVTGPYDVIARTSADTMDELGRLVVSSVQKVPGINRTLTSPVVNL